MPKPSLFDVLDKWKNQELNAARLFSAQALQQPAYQRAKLQRFRSLVAEYGTDKGLRKEPGFIALKAEINVIERLLYPNPLQRYARRAASAITQYFGPSQLIEHERQKVENALQEQQVQKEMIGDQRPNATERFQAVVNEAQQPSVTMDAPRTNGTVPTTMDVPPPTNLIQPINEAMNSMNYAALSKELQELGFGKGLQETLKTEMQTGQPKFALVHRTAGNEERTVFLNFSLKEGGDYALNNYRLSLKNAQFAEPVKQTFYVNPGEKNVTLEQATNLLQGRAIERELKTKEGVGYLAWQQLDFNQQHNGNFKVRPYGEKYGYDMDKVLTRYAIDELKDPTKAAVLKDALRNGQRVQVNASVDGSPRAVLMEANPRFKTMNFIELNGVALKPAQLLLVSQGEGKATSQEKGMQASIGNEELPPPSKNNRKKKGQAI